MEEITATHLTAPDRNGKPALPKRAGPKGMLPSTWAGRSLRVQSLDAFGNGQECSGTYLDYCGAGPVLNLNGARTVLSWDALRVVELVDD
jgi:hypothetical protein